MRTKIIPFSILGFIFLSNLILFQNCGQEAFVVEDFSQVVDSNLEKDIILNDGEFDNQEGVLAQKMEHAPYGHQPIFHSKDRLIKIREVCNKEKNRIRDLKRKGRISNTVKLSYLSDIDSKCTYWLSLGRNVFNRFTMEFGNPTRPTYTARFNCKPPSNVFRHHKARITGTLRYNPVIAAYKYSCGCAEPWMIGKRSSLGGIIYVNGKINCGNKSRIVVCHFRPLKYLNQYSYYDVKGRLFVDWVHGGTKTVKVWGMTDMSLSDLSRDNHRFPGRLGNSTQSLRIGYTPFHQDLSIAESSGFQGADGKDCGAQF